ncbi:MAG TPA: hypothetical protein EYQ84_02860 [Nitrospinaceae bacterium]|nr:hypothetical protein [Nitrospinaceae bacterium]
MELALTTSKATTIDLVFDTTYPLSEGNDVGGHTLLALAAKGNRIVVSNKKDMDKVVRQLICNENSIEADFRKRLITQAYEKNSRHYQELSDHKEPNQATATYELMEGENPYQKPCYLFGFPDNNDPLSISRFNQISGTKPCFTNLADLDNIIGTLCLASEGFKKNFCQTPYLALAAKHGNACGFGADWKSPKVALEKALFGNPQAIWGGEFICNFPITDSLAELLYENHIRKKNLGSAWWMLDLIVAPFFSSEACIILGRRKNRKLMVNKYLTEPKFSNYGLSYRPVRGGFLRQPSANYTLDFKGVEFCGQSFSEHILGSLILAWAVSWSSNFGGNEISLVKDLQLIGSGGGPATTIAAQNAVTRAREQGHSLESSVFAADAFFPFTDAPEILIKAGCKKGLVPKGGKLEKEIRGFFQGHKVDMCFVPQDFRGFCRH